MKDMDRDDIIKASNEALDKPRWHARVWYNTEAGAIDVDHYFMELVELDELIGKGPNWYGLEKIEIILNVPATEKTTIEKAEEEVRRFLSDSED